MKLSIGILAWNEEEYISTTISSLLRQSIFESPACDGMEFEIVCVPNGCSDSTAEEARSSFEALPDHLRAAGLRCRVCEIEQPGKVNAWNRYIHELSDPAADYIFMLDADIRINTPDTLLKMLEALLENPRAYASTDTPIKHIAFKKKKNIADRISLAIAGTTQAAPGQLSGQLYCARAEMLRRIVIPNGMIIEDGFLKQMLCTNLYSEELDNSRIVRAERASHTFKAYTGPKDVFHNQVRQTLGHTVYTFLRDHLRKHVAAGERIEDVLRAESARDPNWFISIVTERTVGSRQSWLVFPGALTLRFRRLRRLSAAARIRALPAALIGFLLDLAVCIAANRRLKQGRIGGVWKDTRTKGMEG